MEKTTNGQLGLTQSLSINKKGSSFKLRCSSLNSLRLRRVFDLFDKNGDDIITVDEISQALILLGLDADVNELRSIITSFIKPPNKGLTFEDFQSLHKSLNDTFFDCLEHDFDPPQQQQKEAHNSEAPNDGGGVDLDDEDYKKQQVESDLSEAFKVFDENGDGYISAKELQAVLSKLGLPEANQELHRIELMISSVDQNHDGQVDFFEFKEMMLRSLLVPSS